MSHGALRILNGNGSLAKKDAAHGERSGSKLLHQKPISSIYGERAEGTGKRMCGFGIAQSQNRQSFIPYPLNAFHRSGCLDAQTF
jgi:hypothetical protein